MTKKPFLVFISLFFLLTGRLFCQSPDFSNHIHINVWAELDCYPELKDYVFSNDDGIFDYSIERIKTVAPFLINGMVYGWEFSYTPSDKLRGVQEYFEITPIAEIENTSRITYKHPWVKENLVHAWAEYEKNDDEKWSYRAWQGINIKKTQGTGKAPVNRGFDGITDAAKNAVKDAVRNYYRPIIKNKPKEILGKIIIRTEPQLGINQGQYLIKLDFFLESDKIIPYTKF